MFDGIAELVVTDGDGLARHDTCLGHSRVKVPSPVRS
jgi:hypothetical protein